MAGPLFRFALKLSDPKEFRRRAARLRREADKEIKAFLAQEAQKLLAEAQSDVPQDGGDLASSALVGPLKKRRGVWGIKLGYKSEHAVPAHEGFSPGGDQGPSRTGHLKRKWFVRAADAFAPGFARRLKPVLRAAISKVRS